MKTKILHLSIIGLAALSFFFMASAFNFFTQSYSADGDFVKWTSPDESANYIFAKLYAQEGRLTINEDYNLLFDDVLHPRSFRSDAGVMKPVSFLGIILLYGKIAALASYKIIPYLTPALGAIGIIFYYLLIARIFSPRAGLLSGTILAFFPPFAYYSARSLFHNIPFAVFLIIGFYFSYLAFFAPAKRRFLSLLPSPRNLGIMAASLSGGSALGLAAAMRSSELLWLAPVLFFLLAANFKKINHLNLPLWLAGFALALLPVAYYNQILYGSPFAGGYPEMNQSIADIGAAGAQLGGFDRALNFFAVLGDNIFRFGFHEKFSAQMLWHYFIVMFPLVFWPAVLGVIYFFLRYKKMAKRQLLFFLSGLFLSAFLVLYYGSWEFHDNPDPEQFTIGNSYVRYWLPVYLAAIPFAAYLMDRLGERLEESLGRMPEKFFSFHVRPFLISGFFMLAVLSFYAYKSINFTAFGSDEGLLQTAGRQLESRFEQMDILTRTEKNAVIITRYHDKLLFPERKVIVGLFDDPKMNQLYSKIAEKLPLYYYNFTFPEKDFNYLNERRLKEPGLKLNHIQAITNDFTLYRLEKVVDEDGQNLNKIQD